MEWEVCSTGGFSWLQLPEEWMTVPLWIPAVFIHKGDAEWPGQTVAICDTCKIPLLHRHLILRKNTLSSAPWQLQDGVAEQQVIAEEPTWTRVNFMPYFYSLMLN